MQMTVDAVAVQKVFRELPRASLLVMNNLIQASAIDVQREERMQVHVGATGDLRRDIKYKLHPERLSADIGPSLERGRFLEEGTKPHWVSVKPGSELRRWADHKGINPFAVQRSIAMKGTKAHPFVKPTFRKMAPIVEMQIVAGFANFIKGVNSGRV